MKLNERQFYKDIKTHIQWNDELRRKLKTISPMIKN